MLSLFVCPFIYLLETLTVVCGSLKINARFRFKLKKVGKTTRPFRYDLNQIHYDYTVEVINKFKRLDLIDRVPDELWMEVHDIVEETGIKTISSKDALQIPEKRREAKGKGEKERYTHLNESSKE